VELHLDPGYLQLLKYAARDASSLPERERERGFTRERERDPESGAPLPGHRTTKREQIGGQETRTRTKLVRVHGVLVHWSLLFYSPAASPAPEPAGPAAVTTDRWPRTRNEERETEDQ
jgi:hypothetical protein